MKGSGMHTLALVVAALLAAAVPANAEQLVPVDAMAALAGRTWTGTNQNGNRFWFWHDGGPSEGTFTAKIGGADVFTGSGTWAIDGEKVCWTWPHDTYCYGQFGRDSGRIWMMRTDGVVHAGELVEGDPEELR